MLRSTALSCVLTLLTIGTASAEPPIPEAPTVAVGVMRLAGDPTVAEEIRMQLRDQLEASGFLPRGFALELDAAAKRAKCKRFGHGCLATIAASLIKDPWGQARPITFMISGTVAPATSGELSRLVVHDVRSGKTVAEFEFHPNPHDLILNIALAGAVVKAIANTDHPPAPITAEEQAILADLDRDPPISLDPIECTYRTFSAPPESAPEPEPEPPRRRWRRWRR